MWYIGIQSNDIRLSYNILPLYLIVIHMMGVYVIHIVFSGFWVKGQMGKISPKQ